MILLNAVAVDPTGTSSFSILRLVVKLNISSGVPLSLIRNTSIGVSNTNKLSPINHKSVSSTIMQALQLLEKED